MQIKYMLTFLLLVLVAACSVNPVTGKKELMLLTDDQERALGLESDPGIVQSFGLYEDATLQEFINTKGKAMGAISHRPEIPYEFKILDSPVVNAFALPGGFVYFTRGILAHFNNEAEFAGVLGHEIGHITARHSASQYSKQIFAQGLLITGVVLSEDFADFADVAQASMGLLFLKFGRDDESQSDELGVEYSSTIGYDAHQMANFFQTIKNLSDGEGGRIPTFLSTHPDPGDRYNRVHQLAATWQTQHGNADLNVGRDSYLRMIDGLMYGEDPRQGFVEDGSFYHPELKFQYPIPAGWKTENTPQEVKMAPENGEAYMYFTIAPQKTFQEAVSAFLSEHELTLVSSNETLVSGMPAYTLVADQEVAQDNQQQAAATEKEYIRMQTYFIRYNDLMYQFTGMSMKENFATYSPQFTRTMTNFRQLTDPSKLNRLPERIQIVTADTNGSLQSLLEKAGMPKDRFKELAILNGMQLETQVARGTLFKVVR
jgi:predicted Zn-dependent protease